MEGSLHGDQEMSTYVVVLLEPDSILLLVLLELGSDLGLTDHVEDTLSSLGQLSVLARDFLTTGSKLYRSSHAPSRPPANTRSKGKGRRR
jgi:hypothetical protein